MWDFFLTLLVMATLLVVGFVAGYSRCKLDQKEIERRKRLTKYSDWRW